MIEQPYLAHPKPSRQYVAADGTPGYVIHTEQWLVGSALLAPAAYVRAACTGVVPEDFHDQSLGLIWSAVAYLALDGLDPSIPAVSALLDRWGRLDEADGEPRLTSLAGHPYALLYSGQAALEAHAGIVHEWGEKRALMAGLAAETRAVYASHGVIDAAARFLVGRGGEMPT